MSNAEMVVKFYKEELGIDTTWEEFLEAHRGEGMFIIPIVQRIKEYYKLKEEGYDVRVSV